MFYLPLSLLVGGKEAESAGPSPQDTWTSVATLCQVVPSKDVSSPPTWHKEYQVVKSQGVWMDYTAVSPEDTRGQEALTQKLRLEF